MTDATASTFAPTDACPCGSARMFADCCGPYIAGKALPPTAEALMRSRYAAYVVGSLDYLGETLAPEAQDDYDPEAVKRWAEDSVWTGLSIRSTEAGGPGDDEGMVEFVAGYRMDGKPHKHHETSRFVRRDGRWYYLDGTMGPPVRLAAPRTEPKIGRNDPCHCGSGKKFKKCHGA